MKTIKLLFAALLSLTAWTGALAQTDAEYEAALAAIQDGKQYYISTTVEGTPYYVKTDGFLTTSKVDAGLFTLEKVFNSGPSDGGKFKDYGFKIKSGNIRFTNAPKVNDHANLESGSLRTRNNQDRENYEAQVLFLNDNGLYAIRACNTAPGETGYADCGRVFWTVHGTAAGYSYEPAYIWNFEQPSIMIDITYVVKDAQGTTLETISNIPTESGTRITTLPADLQRPFTQYNEINETVSEDNTTFEFTATWNGPFQMSTITADMKDAKWYNLTIRKTFSVFVDESIPYQPKDNASEADKISDAYQWAFTGDAYNGIVLYNKKTGAGYTLTKDGENTVMKEGEPYSWTIGKNGDGFTLRETGADINVINHRNRQYLGLWQNGSLTSDGSTFLISEVPVIEDFSQAVTDEIAPWFEASKYFVLSDAAKAEVGYQESYKTLCTLAQYESMKAILDEKKADIANFVLPETGFYRLRNYRHDGQYMTYGEKDGEPVIDSAKNPDEAIDNVIRITKLGENRYSLTIGGLSAITPAKDIIIGLAKTGAEFSIVINKPGVGAFTAGGEYGAIHYSGDYDRFEYYCTGWKDTSDGSQWALEDATINGIDVTITEAGYATLNALFPVTIPEGVTAYTGLIAGRWLTLNELTGTIPAATPVVLAGEPGTYSFAFTDDAAAVENDLKGTYEACKPDGAFTLQVINGQIGFYSFSGEAIPANKAYITLPAGTEVKSLGITFDNATAITDIANGKNRNGHCFNLAGLRVNSTQKGVYILNGKKVVKF